MRRAIFLIVAIAAGTVAGCTPGGNAASSGASPAAQAVAGENLLDQVKHRGVLVIATDANYKPQSFRNPDGSWVGFDIDVGREVARRLGLRPIFETTSFAVITAGGWQGRWDVDIDSMSITDARTKVLWFTEPYYFTPASFAVHKDSAAHTLADLAGKRLGVGVATTYDNYLGGKMSTARIKPPANTTIVRYDTDALAIADLAKGNGVKLDGVLTALPTIRASIASGMPLRIIEPPVYEDSLAIALDRSSPAQSAPLLWAIDSIIHDMHRDGTLSRLSIRYYGIDITHRR